MTPPVVLTIAGSDSGGGAGMQADLKSFAALGVHGTAAVSVITAQNTVGVRGVHTPPSTFLAEQISAVLADFSVEATKTGFLATAENVACVVTCAGALGQLVVDPVMVSSRGDRIVSEETQQAYVRDLFPLVTVITPNAREAALLVGRPVNSVDDMERAARQLFDFGPKIVVVKGGGLPGDDSVDVVFDGTSVTFLRAPRIETANNHGTGCSFSAATAAYLALGYPTLGALQQAKVFVTEGLRASASWRLGAGHGPIDHMHRYRPLMPQSTDAQSPS